MKNILFKMLPLLAAVLFATSCSKDDDNGNTVVSDNTNTSVTPASNDASEPVNPSTPSETVQVLYDENGVPYIPFSIMVGREDSESLSKYFASDYEGNGIKQYFDKEDKITITGKSKKIQGELTVDETKYDWPNSWSTSAVFSGKLWGEDIESLVVDDWLIATLNDGKPLSEPQVYDMGDNKLTKAITDCSYLTVEFQYKDYLASTVRLKQNTAFLVFDMEYSAKVIVHCNGKDHTFYLPCSGYLFSGQTRQTVIAVPDDSYVRSCFLKDEHYIDIANDNGKVIHNIKRLQPSDVITRGTFSISEDKWGNTHEVFFSKSNLMVAISSDAVGFYGNPWAIAHKSGDDVGVNHGDNGYADLFGWGTWLNCDDDDMLKTIVGDFEDYYLWKGDKYSYANPHETVELLNSNWYVLTDDEWDYLLNKRKMNPANTKQIRYIRASIKLDDDNTLVPGLIVFPDCCPLDVSNIGVMWPPFESTYDVNGGFDDNIIEENSWESFTIYTEGAIFLPCAGIRSTTTKVNGVDHVTGINSAYSSGYYWTSDSQFNNHIGVMRFDNTNLWPGTTTEPRNNGCSVRLVRDVR